MIYADGLVDDAFIAFAHAPPACRTGHTGRIGFTLFVSADLEDTTAFICGSYGFVEAGQLLLEGGREPQRVRTERFGLTG